MVIQTATMDMVGMVGIPITIQTLMVIQTSTVVCLDSSNKIINKIKSFCTAGDYEIVHNQGGNVNTGQIYTRNNFNYNSNVNSNMNIDSEDGMFS